MPEPANKVTGAEVARLQNFALTEKEWQAEVERTFREHGWLVYHTYRSERSAPGFPDLLAIHIERGALVVAELKVGKNVLTNHQRRWLYAFKAAGVRSFVWYPANRPEVLAVAKGGA